jgi:hypothetical protein
MASPMEMDTRCVRGQRWGFRLLSWRKNQKRIRSNVFFVLGKISQRKVNLIVRPEE